ncbi:MAG: outer membrane protein assembly factor BamB family protein, partial [Planctomycetota bacterium]
MKKAVLFLSWLVMALPCAGEIIIVDDGGYGDFDNIQAAIDDSNDGDIIYILPGTYTGPGNRDIDYGGRAITVTGVEPQDPHIVAATVIDCESAGRGFYIHSGEDGNSVVAGLTITNGYAGSGGGMVCYFSSPTITNCIITVNTSYERYGGGIYCAYGSPTIEYCVISENTAPGAGGIYCYESDPIIVDCYISDNRATGHFFGGDYYGGGGVYCDNSSPTIADCTISGNLSYVNGGGVYCDWAAPKTSGCTFSGNTAEYGGGICCDNSSPTIEDCVISNNTASRSGGGIDSLNSHPIIINCLISYNKASLGSGGAIYCPSGWPWEDYTGTLNIADCTFIGNEAIGAGGAILGGLSAVRITGCTFMWNVASADGGALCYCEGVIRDCVFTANSAGDEGGAVDDCWANIVNCVFNGNWAGGNGGAMYHFWSLVSLYVTNCTFSKNASGGIGGAIYSEYDGYLKVTNCVLWGNRDISGTGESGQIAGSPPTVQYSCIQDDDPNDANIPFGGTDHNNIDDNPIFVRDPNDGGDGWGIGDNDDYGDLHLTAGSPCINAGHPSVWFEPNQGDMDGEPRVMGLVVDIGADEYPLQIVIVTRPEGQEVWVAGSLHEIVWTSDVYEGNIDILFSADDGNNWQGVESNVPDTGSYTWDLPVEVDSNQCVISVVPSVPDPNVICIESGLFTIHPDSPGPPVASKWKSLGGDYDRRGLSANYGPELGCVKWTFDTAGPIPTSITIGAYDRVPNSAVLSAASVGPDGTIYVGTESGRLHAIDIDGNLRWTHTADGFIYSSPAVSTDGNTIYVCSGDGVVDALGRDGTELWSFQTKDTIGIGSSILASPAIGPDGTVYMAAVRDPNLYALDPNDGSVKWACNFEHLISPAYPDMGMYFGWALASPVVGPDGTIYQTLLYDPNLYAIDPNTGDVLWSVTMPEYRPRGDSGGWSEPVVGPDGTVYFGASDP